MAMRLFYDGGCNLCHRSKLRAEKWAEQTGVQLTALPLQSAEGLAQGYSGNDMILESGQVYAGAEAWLEISKLAPWYLQIVFTPMRWPGFRVVAAWGYRLIAKYRIKWFGQRECQIPSK